MFTVEELKELIDRDALRAMLLRGLRIANSVPVEKHNSFIELLSAGAKKHVGAVRESEKVLANDSFLRETFVTWFTAKIIADKQFLEELKEYCGINKLN